MATGSIPLFSMRGALGATEGASTTPTRLLYVPVGAVDLSGIQQFETIEDRRAWAKATGLVATFNGIENNVLAINNAPVSVTDIGWWLSTIPGVVSGAGTGAGTPTTTDTSAYTRIFKPSQTVTTAGATGGYDAHLQFGYVDLLATVGWSLPGLRCTSLSLNWNKRASGMDTGLTFSGTWTTPKTCTQITSFTGSLSDRAQVWSLGNSLLSYVDSAYGSIGGTADTNITQATWNWQRPAVFHDGMDGTGLHTSMHFPAQETSTLSLTRKFSDTTELTAWKARTQRAVRLKAEGSLIGAVSAKDTTQLDFVGTYASGGHTHTAQDDMLYATLNFEEVYDSTLLAGWAVTTINAVSASYATA